MSLGLTLMHKLHSRSCEGCGNKSYGCLGAGWARTLVNLCSNFKLYVLRILHVWRMAYIFVRWRMLYVFTCSTYGVWRMLWSVYAVICLCWATRLCHQGTTQATPVGLARTVYIHRTWPYIWWFPSQKYCKNTVYTPHIYMVLANPKHLINRRQFRS